MSDDPKEPVDRGAAGTAGNEGASITDSVFDAEFDAAAKADDKADISAADDPNKVKAGEDPTDTKVEAKKPDDSPVKTQAEIDVESTRPPESKQVETPVKPDAVVDDPEKIKQQYRTLQGIHKHDRETWETEKTKLLADLEEAKKPITPEKPTETDAKSGFVDSLTPEQKEEFEQYEKDFEFVSKMEGLKRTKELSKLRKEMEDWKVEVLGQISTTQTELTAQVEPAIKMAGEKVLEAHYKVIREGYTKEDGTVVPGHSDFKKYVDDKSIAKWIESKPAYLQPALKRVTEKGSARDAIDLLSDFKRENSIQDTTTTSDNVIDLSTKKAEKKAALTVVETRKGAVNVNQAVAEIYEDAFDEALKK